MTRAPRSLVAIAAVLSTLAAQEIVSGYRERPAVPVRLVGVCGGLLLGAVEESAFPADCDWIEPVRF